MEFTPFEDLPIEEQLLTYISDMYKSAYGHRPSLSYYSNYSEQELRDELDHLSEVVEQVVEEEEQRERESVKKFQESVDLVVECGAGDVETALRWIAESEDVDLSSPMDIEGFLWRRGILYTDYGSDIRFQLSTINSK